MLTNLKALAQRPTRKALASLSKPEFPIKRDFKKLCVASQRVREPHPWRYEHGLVHLELAVPPHAIAAHTVEFAPESTRGPRI